MLQPPYLERLLRLALALYLCSYLVDHLEDTPQDSKTTSRLEVALVFSIVCWISHGVLRSWLKAIPSDCSIKCHLGLAMPYRDAV